jgi:hypothetical protein
MTDVLDIAFFITKTIPSLTTSINDLIIVFETDIWEANFPQLLTVARPAPLG